MRALWVLLLAVIWWGMAASCSPGQGGAPPVALTKLPGWTYHSATADAKRGSIRVTQPTADGAYGWVELPVTIDLDRYPEILVEVEGANWENQWQLKIDPTARGEPPELVFVPGVAYNGVFVFPMGEYFDRYGKTDAIVRFFVLGKGGTTVTLKRLELLGSGAAGVTERIRIDESLPMQEIDGAGGQADYPLWNIGGPQDKVAAAEIQSLLEHLKKNGVTVVRVGVHGGVAQAAARNPEDDAVQGLLKHLQALTAHGFRTVIVLLSPPPETRNKPPKSDEWLQSFVAHSAQLVTWCYQQEAPIHYFELQHGPQSHAEWWDATFLARCGAALAEELERRKLAVEVVGPGLRDGRWVGAWAQHLGDRCHTIAVSAGSDGLGWAQHSAREVATVIAQGEQTARGPHRFWISAYNSWAWGNADEDRRGAGGPCDGYRYGLIMAELTHRYIKAGIACPLVWELYDVRRVEETAGKEPPERWGTIKYKTEQWAKRSHFHTLGHYFRALRPGSTVYDCRSDGGLLPVAVLGEDGWHVVVCNLFRYPKSAVVKLPSGEWGAQGQWSVTEPNNPLATSTVAFANGEAKVSLPGYGVGSLVLWPGGSRPETVDELPTADVAQELELRRGERLFEEHFDSEFLDQWQAAKPEDTLVMAAEPPGILNAEKGCYLTTRDLFPPERVMEFRVSIGTPNDFDVCALPWFAEDHEEFYQISLTPGGFAFHKFLFGFQGLGGEQRAALPVGGWHDVAIRIADGKIALWVDEKLVYVCTPESVPADFGRVGFRGNGMKIDDVAVYDVAPLEEE